MKRVWKPLDIANSRLYAVSLQYFDKNTNKRCAANLEPPLLVLSSSPSQAARLIHHIYNSQDSSIRVDCYGKAVKVLMPKFLWEDGIPSIT